MAVKVYVASSWRNDRQPEIVQLLRFAGHEVYDFRNPLESCSGFHWSEIAPDWQGWSPEKLRHGLEHRLACKGFRRDFAAMQWADACVLLMPCGRSAHLEAGWFVGAGKPVCILLSSGEPELMYKMANRLCVQPDEITEWLAELDSSVSPCLRGERM
jgi:hypothetical protein